MSDSSLVLLDVSDRIATVTLNRPEARNALSSALLRRLRVVMAEADAHPDADVIILTGTDPAFTAGLDLKEIGSGSGLGSAGSGDPVAASTAGEPGRPWAPLTKPLIGAVNGVAITGGFEIALNCDFLVASERARFADTHARVGILPGWGLTLHLCQSVGVRRARELSATGNFLSAQQAYEWGLVNHVVPHDELLPFARSLAAAVVDNNRPAVTEMLALYDRVAATTADEAWAIEAEVNADWIRRTYDPAAVAARHAGVVARGRAQTAD